MVHQLCWVPLSSSIMRGSKLLSEAVVMCYALFILGLFTVAARANCQEFCTNYGDSFSSVISIRCCA